MNILLEILVTAYDRLVGLANFFRSPFLLVTRVYLFWQLFLIGQAKFGNLPKTSDYFDSLGMLYPYQTAWLVALAETGGSILLIMGFLSRPAALIISVVMIVALITGESDASAAIFTNAEMFLKGKPLPYLFAALLVFLFGPGVLSIDWLLKRRIHRRIPLRHAR